MLNKTMIATAAAAVAMLGAPAIASAHGHHYVDPDTQELLRAKDSYSHPQPHACLPGHALIHTPTRPIPIQDIHERDMRRLQVFDRDAVDSDPGEVLPDPVGDLARRARATAHPAAYELVDPPRAHIGWELGQGRRGVGAVEAADGHHRKACRELVACR